MTILRALLGSLLAIVMIGCGQAAVPSDSTAPPEPSASRAPSVFPSESRSPAPTPAALAIVSIETRGGHCTTGSCNRLMNIEADGKLHEVIPKDEELGTIPGPLLEALRVEVEQANYRLLQSRPFTGLCPTASDGQETVYVFHATAGDEEIASCKVAIDANHPLFQAVAAALAAAGGL
ncbi:MAG: hypothetical protein QOF49_1031 [Chloroflexota bacterium]|nr:hypothetical protein [Chloroflexota bacterium]